MSLSLQAKGTNAGLVKGKNVTLHAGELENTASGTIEAEEIKGGAEAVTNAGLLKGDLIALSGQTFKNVGEIFASSELGLTLGTLLENTKSGLMSASQLFSIQGNAVFINEGEIRSAGKVCLAGNGLENSGTIEAYEDLSLSLQAKGTNAGLIKGQNVTLCAQELENAASGTIEAEEMKGSAEAITNAGLLKGDLIALSGQVFKNVGEVFASLDLALSLETLFENLQHGVASAGRLLSLQGRARVDNKGNLGGGDRAFLQGHTVVNSGKIASTQELDLDVSEEVDNTGLVFSPRLRITTFRGRNYGPLNQEPNPTDALRGLVAPELLVLTVNDLFINNGHMLSHKRVELGGRGKLVNEGGDGQDPQSNEGGEIRSEGEFVSSLRGVTNEGSIIAHTFLRFDNLTEDFINTGSLKAEGDVRLTSTAHIFNGGKDGLIGGGTVSVVAQSLHNHKLIAAFSGPLALTLHTGENHNILYGQGGVDLTIQNLFTGYQGGGAREAAIETPESLVIRGEGTFKNHGKLKIGKRFELQTHFENEGTLEIEGDLECRTQGKVFQNNAGGEILSGSKITLSNTPSFHNKGHIEAPEISATTIQDFSNDGTIVATGGSLILEAQSSTNTGLLSGETDVALAVGKKFQNLRRIMSKGKIHVYGEGELHNLQGGVIGGTKALTKGEETSVLLIDLPSLENSGFLLSAQELIFKNLRRSFVNETSGVIRSERFLSFQEMPERLPQFTNKGELSALMLAPACVRLAILTFLNEGKFFLAEEGDLSLDIEEGTNAGNLSTPGTLSLRVGHRMSTMRDSYLGGGSVIITGEGVLHNEGKVRGKASLLYGAGHLTNTGDLLSDQKVDIRGNFTNEGTIGSKGTLDLQGTTASFNTGMLVGNGGITATFKKFDNTGTMVSAEGDVTATLEEGINSGTMGAARKLTLRVGQRFSNKEGAHLDADVVSLQGDGILDNTGIVHGESHLLYEAGHLNNTGELSSSQKVEVRRDFMNEGTIGSSGTLTLQGTDLSSNSGKLFGDKGVTATFKAFNNAGALSSAEGDVTAILETPVMD